MLEHDDLTDAIIEDTVHCTVCGASWVLGGNEEYIILDPPGEMQQALERGCHQVKLCEECVERLRESIELVYGDLSKLLAWSTELPNEVGWYWFRATQAHMSVGLPAYTKLGKPVIVLVGRDQLYIHHPLCVRFPQGTMAVAEMGGEWAGPIREPH